MPICTITIESIELTQPRVATWVFEEIVNQHEVWVTWNFKLDGEDQIKSRPVEYEDLDSNTIILNEVKQIDVTDKRRLELRLKLEVRTELVGSVNRLMEFPFANRREHAPAGDDADPFAFAGSAVFVLSWFSEHSSDDVERRTHRTPRYQDSQWISDDQRSNRFAVRNGLATINTEQRNWFWARDPALPDSLVIRGREYSPPVSAFRNWKDGADLPNGWSRLGVFHQERKTMKANSIVNAIVIHETAGFGLIDTGFPPAGPWVNTATEKKDIAAHFCVHTDGSIAQHYDPIQWLGHAGPRNSHSVGIEVVNSAWTRSSSLTNNKYQIGNHLSAGEWLDTVRGWAAERYVVPKVEQLEALARLVDDLVFLIGMPDRDLSVIEESVDGRERQKFLMSYWPSRFGPGAPDTGGLYHHFMLGGIYTRKNGQKVKMNTTDQGQAVAAHTDGSFLALYVFLRRKRGFCAKHARMKAMELCDEHPSGQWTQVNHQNENVTVVTNGHSRTYNMSFVSKFIDVTDVTHEAGADCENPVLVTHETGENSEDPAL